MTDKVQFTLLSCDLEIVQTNHEKDRQYRHLQCFAYVIITQKATE